MASTLTQAWLNGADATPVPLLSWAICTIARSGSSWLSQLVASTGILGLPDEYLLDWRRQAQRRGLSPLTSFEDYLTYLLQRHATANGVFAVKGSVDELSPFFEFFPAAPCVWLSRENKIEQAVSWHRAHDGNVWVRTRGAAPAREFQYSLDRVLYFHDEILHRERRWQAFFAQRDAPPLTMTYETVCRDPLHAVRKIAAYLGLAAHEITQVASPLQIVRDESTAELVRQAAALLHDRTAAAHPRGD